MRFFRESFLLLERDPCFLSSLFWSS
jgi:hypothetical protein